MSKMSWEKPPYHNDDTYMKLCENSKPSDFYFVAQKDYEGFVMVAITPKLYFHKNGYMWDQSMQIEHLLPNDLSESMESVWESDSDRTVEEIRQDMLSRGFEENEQFTELVAQEYD
jgi:hypothetical protein